jgi:hypothetical protein
VVVDQVTADVNLQLAAAPSGRIWGQILRGNAYSRIAQWFKPVCNICGRYDSCSCGKSDSG